MDVERSFDSSSLSSTMREEAAADDKEAVAATDLMEMEAAEILTALAHSKKRDAVVIPVEFSAKWGCKGKRVRKRVSSSSSSESPPSGIVLNPVDPVQSGFDLPEEDRAVVSLKQIQGASTTVETVEAGQNAESRDTSHPCAEVRSRQNVTKAEKGTHGLHRMLTNKDSDLQMIRESQQLFNIVGMGERDIWEHKQQGQMTRNIALVKSVIAEKKDEPVTKYMKRGRKQSRHNLTEAEKEERRLCRILANRESARKTIRRRQALCENLSLKVADLTRENGNLKRCICSASSVKTSTQRSFQAKELAMKEYLFQESTNKNLKAEMAKAIKAKEGEAQGEVKLAHHVSGPSRNYPIYLYNQHPFPPFCWPSIVQSSHPLQSQCGQQYGLFGPSSISPPTNGRLDSSHDHENPANVNGPKSPLYAVPYPRFFSLPGNENELLPQASCGLNNIKDETSMNNGFSAGCSLKSVLHEEYKSSLPIEVEKEIYGSIEASSNNTNCIPVKCPPDGGGQCIRFQVKEEIPVLTPPCSAGTTFVAEQEKKPGHVVNIEASSVRVGHNIVTLPEDNQDSGNSTSKEAQDAVSAADARRKRKELIKLKKLHDRLCWVQR